MFSFSSTLDRLRQKPEAVRVRYFFFSISVSFIFVIALWAFSLRASISAISESETTDALVDNVHGITKDAPVSLEDLMKMGKTLEEKGAGLNTITPNPPQNPQFDTEKSAESERGETPTASSIPTESTKTIPSPKNSDENTENTSIKP